MQSMEPNRNTVKVAHNAQRTSKATALRVLPKSGTKRMAVYEFILRRGSGLCVNSYHPHFHQITGQPTFDFLGADNNLGGRGGEFS